MSDEVKSRAVELSFDLTNQFLSLALAGVGFAIGLSASTELVHSWLFWTVIFLFGASCTSGLLFLMRGVAEMAAGRRVDLWANVPRCLSLFQMLAVLAGAVLLLIMHARNGEF